MLTKICKTCGKKFKKPYARSKKSWKKSKFCSKKCLNKSKIGKPAWNKGLKMINYPQCGFQKGIYQGYGFQKKHKAWNKGFKKETNESVKKSSEKNTGKNNYLWKGNNVGYHALHIWINKEKGKPKICEFCGKKYDKPRSIQWANKDHKYRRNLDDFIALCVSCHRKYDIKNNGYLLKFSNL